jgi:hypothetical protein
MVAGWIACAPASAQTNFAPQQIVDRCVALQPSADHAPWAEIMRGGAFSNRFDANRYFSVLRAVDPDDDLVLDWVYWKRGIGGFPVLYVRPSETAPFADFETYAAQTTNAPLETISPQSDVNQRLRFGYLEKLQVEDSPEGFFQLVVLRLLGDRFYMYWHEFYNEVFLVCSKPGWEALLQSEKQRGEPYAPPPPEFIAAAEKLDFTPHIQFKDEQVEVTVTTYSPFGGLDLHSFAISRPYPHRILTHSQTNLLKHTQRFVF